MNLKSPYPWFGGKSKAAPIIWQRFGDIPNFVDPFFGSNAVLIKRPDYDPLKHTETINDKDGFVANFWRALQKDPHEVAYWADHQVNEIDLHARHQWLVDRREFVEEMMRDPNFCDPKVAGWWVWGLCQWIGSGWCANPSKSRRGNERDSEKGVYRQRPDLSLKGVLNPRNVEDIASGNNGRGVHRKLPHLGDNGRGVHRQRPHLGDNGMGVHRKRPHTLDESIDSSALLQQGVIASPASTLGGQRYGSASQASDRPDLYHYFDVLSARLRNVRVCCGDWKRVLGPSPTTKLGVTGIIFDPPYDVNLRAGELYAIDDSNRETPISSEVREWAIAHGDNPLLRIAVCGYSDEHLMPDGWECVEWSTGGGYDGQNRDRDNENRKKERIWFSPHCIKPRRVEQLSLIEV